MANPTVNFNMDINAGLAGFRSGPAHHWDGELTGDGLALRDRTGTNHA